MGSYIGRSIQREGSYEMIDALTFNGVITTPSNGQIISWNGSAWVNGNIPAPSLTLDALTDVNTAGATTGMGLLFNGSSWYAASLGGGSPHALDDHTDVSGTPSSGDVLTWNGSGWAPAAPSGGGGGTAWVETATLNVSSTGNDTTGDGSVGAPYLTIQKALTQAKTLNANKVIINIVNNINNALPIIINHPMPIRIKTDTTGVKITYNQSIGSYAYDTPYTGDKITMFYVFSDFELYNMECSAISGNTFPAVFSCFNKASIWEGKNKFQYAKTIIMMDNNLATIQSCRRFTSIENSQYFLAPTEPNHITTFNSVDFLDLGNAPYKSGLTSNRTVIDFTLDNVPYSQESVIPAGIYNDCAHINLSLNLIHAGFPMSMGGTYSLFLARNCIFASLSFHATGKASNDWKYSNGMVMLENSKCLNGDIEISNYLCGVMLSAVENSDVHMSLVKRNSPFDSDYNAEGIIVAKLNSRISLESLTFPTVSYSYNFAYAEKGSMIFINGLTGISSPVSSPTFSSSSSGAPTFGNYGSFIYKL